MSSIKLEEGQLLACRICLATNTKLFGIYEYNLDRVYEDTLGTTLSAWDGFPQHLCGFCRALLLKSADLRQRSRRAEDLLRQSLIHTHFRAAAESVAKQLLSRLDSEDTSAVIGEPLLSPGPWLQHDSQASTESEWTDECETRLRAHAARLKSDTVSLRNAGQAPALFSYHDEQDELSNSVGNASLVEMEAAVMMQEALAAREARAAGGDDLRDHKPHKTDSTRSRRRRERHWLETQASETDL